MPHSSLICWWITAQAVASAFGDAYNQVSLFETPGGFDILIGWIVGYSHVERQGCVDWLVRKPIRTSNQSKLQILRLTHGLNYLVLVLLLIAIHLGLRWEMIRRKDESIVFWAPPTIALVFTCASSLFGARLRTTILGAMLLSFVSASSWAIECVTRSPGTSFMHGDLAYENYGSDAELNVIAVLAMTLFNCVMCSIAGSILHYIRKLLTLSRSAKALVDASEPGNHTDLKENPYAPPAS